MFRRALLPLLPALALVTACVPPAEPPQGPAASSAEELRRIEQAKALLLPRDADAVSSNRNRSACDALGGRFGQDGRAGAYHCELTYPDAGKACSDDTDCVGTCRARPEPARAGQTPGICQQTTSPFGCYATVKNGRVEGTICVD